MLVAALFFQLELGFDSGNRPILVHFINRRPHQAHFRSIVISEDVALKCHLRLWINGVIAFDSHTAVLTLELTAKWAAKLQSLITL